MSITHEDLKVLAWERSSPEERQAYLDAGPEADAAIAAAEIVYQMRTHAGLTQTELARRMGSAQPFVSAIERGARVPTLPTLQRIASATGNRLTLVAAPV